MSGFRSPLDAYRQDLSRARGRNRLAANDEFWIILATGMRRLAQAPPRSRRPAARRLSAALVTFAKEAKKSALSGSAQADVELSAHAERMLAVADSLARFPDPESASALVARVRNVAADAEEAGAIFVAREILTDLNQLALHAPPLDRGTVLLQLGRISRTLGELDGALDLLRAAGDLGRASEIPELTVREALGEAVVARTRGNYPASRQLFQTSLDGAIELGLSDVMGMAHQGLMIIAAESGDFDSALTHGWEAYSSARSAGSREAEVLGNLAQLCAKVGYDAAALAGFAAALARARAPRLRLPILAGLVTCAARVGDADRVSAVARAVAVEASDAFPFETSSAWLAVSVAHLALGNAAASDAAAQRAAAIARAHGFHELTHRLEQAPAAPAELAPSGMGVIRTLEAWASDSSAELLLSTSPTG